MTDKILKINIEFDLSDLEWWANMTFIPDQVKKIKNDINQRLENVIENELKSIIEEYWGEE